MLHLRPSHPEWVRRTERLSITDFISLRRESGLLALLCLQARRRLGDMDDSNDSLSVSPDGRWILYTQADADNADIMLVENFR